ncbi:GTPase domain-containing protein [Tumidithrix helvetica PCC 7403]|uniref:GTPase domain-containing protein n=1 Tax=Tumidithrix helvetica TaxID=3457545 RepID=UPI003CA14B48
MSDHADHQLLESFFESSKAKFESEIHESPDILNIVVIGRVSSGKSSLVNALLKKTRKDSLFKVRAESGVTSDVQCLKLNERVRLIDSPGLDDVRVANSDATQRFLKRIDIGVLVVDGSSDARQKKHLDDLKKQCDIVFVVFNKIDEYDKWKPTVLERVIQQWKVDLGVAKIYPTCTFGYDPEVNHDMKLDIRGVEALRNDIEALLQSKWQNLLDSRSFTERRIEAVKIIANAMLRINEEAFMPKRSPFILGTLAIAVTEIHYLLLGQTLSGKEIRKRMALFTSGDLCAASFLWYGSPLAPDFVLDPITGRRALSSSLVMLLTFVELLRRKLEFTTTTVELESRPFRVTIKPRIEDTHPADWQEISFWQNLALSALLSQGLSSSVHKP